MIHPAFLSTTPLLFLLAETPTPLLSQNTIVLEEDFESSTNGEMPNHWFSPSVGPAGLTVEEDKNHLALLELKPTDDGFANIIRSLPVGDMARSRVRLSASVRVEGDARAQLWLRFDYDDGTSELVDNMQDRPITSGRSGDGSEPFIVADAQDKEGQAVLGCMAFGEGRVYLDNVLLEILGPSPAAVKEGPRALESQGLANHVAFTRLLGAVRYFHPSDESAECDWDAFAVQGARRVESAEDTRALVTILNELFKPIAPTVRIFESGSQPPPHVALSRPAEEDRLYLRRWHHNGMGQKGKNSLYRSWRSKKLSREPAPFKAIDDPIQGWSATLAPGVECLVPLTLYGNRKKTFPITPKIAKTPALALPPTTGSFTSEWSSDDRATRLAAIILCWNVFQHFYPYFDVTDVEWDAELDRAFQAAAEDDGDRAFLRTLRRLVATLADGHGGVKHTTNYESASLPVSWDWIEDSLVVTVVDPETRLDVQVGDKVLALDGVDAKDAIAVEEELISAATPQGKRHVSLIYLRRGEPGASVKLRLERGGKEHEVRATFARSENRLEERRPAPLAILEEGIWYVDLDRAKTENFLQILKQLESAPNIIFDMRGYPSDMDAFQLFPHLIDETVHSAWWKIPVISQPNLEAVEWSDSRWTIEPKAPYLTGRRVFITDGRAISYAESCMGIVEHYELGDIVGDATAGTNGNVNPFSLPGGYTVSWTGMKVVKHDGSRHHGVGILPTVPVSRTRGGVIDGRDELLDAAIELLKE